MSASDSGASVHSFAELRAQAKIVQLNDVLAKSDRGVTLGSVSNIVLILERDPVLSGMCAFNEFTNATVLLKAPPPMSDDARDIPGPYPRPWTGADITHTQFYVQRIYTQQAKATDVDAAMTAVAAANRFHPVRDWLGSLKWDGEKRLDRWLVDAFGVPDDSYHSDVGVSFLLAAVRRVRQPGCKFDHMPVLEGAQGMGKSTAVKTLFGPEWFTDSLPAALESRDAALGLQGVWVAEFGEIEQIIRTEVEVIKAFLSRAVDRFRAPYGRSFLEYPRQSVMIGTTNEGDYLRDATGNRRFWPIRCTKADAEWLQANREQVWAEAACREASGEDHWLTETTAINDAQKIQSRRMQEDVWEDLVISKIGDLKYVTSAQIMTEFLFIPVERQDRRVQMRVAGIMKRRGWVNRVERKSVGTERRWRPAGSDPRDDEDETESPRL
jgi:predicted P-loop ATPase